MDERLRNLLIQAAASESSDPASGPGATEAPLGPDEERELATLLRQTMSAPPVDVAAVSLALRERAHGELMRHASKTYTERLVRALAVAVLPLPFVTGFASWALPRMYAVLAGFLPSSLAGLIVGSYALAVALSVATAYASIPLLTERMGHAGRRSKQALPIPAVAGGPS